MAELLDMLAQLEPQQQNAGLAKQAMDINQAYPIWYSQMMDAKMSGVDFPPFKQWAAMNGYNVAGAMPSK